MNMEACQFSLSAEDQEPETEVNSPKAEYQRAVKQTLMDDMQHRILTFKEKPPLSDSQSCRDEIRVLYTQHKPAAAAKVSMRHIPQSSDRVLDAPDFRPDFYLNLVDWSSTNIVAVALGDVCA
jgi:hypothetical protein